MKRETAENILNQTREDYNRIAPDFAIKRTKLSQDFKDLCKYANNGDNILDLGCGSGRLNDALEDIDIRYTGADNSEVFIEWAQKHYPNKKFILLKDNINLPFKNESFDKVFCLALIHHIPSKILQEEYLKEIYRVLKPNGELILTTWNIWQNPKMRNLVRSNNLKKIFGLNKLDWNDLKLPYHSTSSNLTVERYLHAFKQAELDALMRKAGFTIKLSTLNYRGKKVVNSNILVHALKP